MVVVGRRLLKPQARAPYGLAILIVNDIVASLNIANWHRRISDIVEPRSRWLHLPTYRPRPNAHPRRRSSIQAVEHARQREASSRPSWLLRTDLHLSFSRHEALSPIESLSFYCDIHTATGHSVANVPRHRGFGCAAAAPFSGSRSTRHCVDVAAGDPTSAAPSGNLAEVLSAGAPRWTWGARGGGVHHGLSLVLTTETRTTHPRQSRRPGGPDTPG